MLVSMKEILDAAQKDNYCVAAPSIVTEFMIAAAVEAAEELRAPMILNIGFHGIINGSIVRIGRIAEDYARDASVPVCINLDHGMEYAHAIWAIRAGFTSIMVDRSSLPYEENVAQVKELVKIAHAVGVTVEAELGHVGKGENYDVDGVSNLTDPDQAAQYVQQTGVDCLAVAIGTAHGDYKGTPHIDFDLLRAIDEKVSVPLVLHGGSGTGDENLARAARSGINKINIGTDLRKAAIVAGENAPNSFVHVAEVKRGYKEKLMYYMKLFGECDRY